MRVNRIFKNTSIGIFQNIFNIIVSVFVNGYIASTLGIDEYGKFIFAFAFPQVFSVIADFGLQGYYTKKIAGNRDNTRQFLGEMIVIRLAFSVIAVVLAVGALSLTSHSGDAKSAVMVGILSVLVAQTFITNAWTVFQAHEEMKFVAVSNIISRVTIAVLSVLVLSLGGAMMSVTVVYALGYLIQVGYCFRVIYKENWRPVFVRDNFEVWPILREAWPFSLFGIFSCLALAIDKTLLSLINGDASLGIYNAAASLSTNSFMISIAVSGAVFPALVQAYSKNQMDDFSKKMQIILKWMVLLGIPLALIITFYSHEIISFIYRNSSYELSVKVLQILIWLLPIDLIARVLRYALIAINREHAVTKYYGIGLLLNICLNLYLMPKYSYLGAAYAAIITQSFLMIVQVFLYFDTVKAKIVLPLVRILVGNLVLYLALSFWSEKVYWMFGGVLGVVLFSTLMFLFRVVKMSEFDAILLKGDSS